jgi:hypothetical protein
MSIARTTLLAPPSRCCRLRHRPRGPALDTSMTDVVFRQFDCTETAPDGSCNKKECRASPGGFTFYCDTYAYYCVKAGHKWEGTKVKGTCTRTHPG